MGSDDRAAGMLERALGPRRAPRVRGQLFGRQHVLPDYIVMGGGRSGASRLLAELERCPNVLPGPGETHFFDSRRHTYGLSWYRLQFADDRSRRAAYEQGLHPVVTGESSSTYLSHPTAPWRAARGVPSARLVVLLRDPVTRAASHWAWRRLEGTETRSFREVVEAEIGPPGDAAGLRIPRDRHVGDPLIVRRGIYRPQVERWLTHFHREAVLIVVAERWFRDPDGVMAEVHAFLGLPPWQGPLPPREVAAEQMTTADPGPPGAPESAVLDRLRDFYRPYDEDLADDLEMDLDWDAPVGA